MINAKPIGVIQQINRYPVKSFAGERLSSVKLKSYGLYGDRSHAFVDNTKAGWSRYITARQIPQMLKYKAELDIQSSDQDIPQVKITCPDGRIHHWNQQLLQNIQALSDKTISMECFSLNSGEQLAVDDGSILIITNQSLRKIEQLWGKPVDDRRFRANFLLVLNDDIDFNESDYIGRRLGIGDTELSIKSLCERCAMITIDPDSLDRDPTLLKQINQNMNLCFGMYADVVRVGTVHAGDVVYLVE